MYTYDIGSLNKIQQFEQYSPLFVTLRGVFLAMILFCASFLSPYIGCNYQYMMKVKPHTRYLMLFLVIYFSINLVDPDKKNMEDPLYAVFRSVFVFIVFILLNNIHVNSIVVMMTFFALLVLTSKYYSYYKQPEFQTKASEQIRLDILFVIQCVLVTCIFIFIMISLFTNDKNDKRTNLLLNRCVL